MCGKLRSKLKLGQIECVGNSSWILTNKLCFNRLRSLNVYSLFAFTNTNSLYVGIYEHTEYMTTIKSRK